MNRIVRILAGTLALSCALAVLPAAADAAPEHGRDTHAVIERGRADWDRDAGARWERERVEHDRACSIAWANGAPGWRLREMSCAR